MLLYVKCLEQFLVCSKYHTVTSYCFCTSKDSSSSRASFPGSALLEWMGLMLYESFPIPFKPAQGCLQPEHQYNVSLKE